MQKFFLRSWFVLLLLLTSSPAFSGVDFDTVDDLVSLGVVDILPYNRVWSTGLWVFLEGTGNRGIIGQWISGNEGVAIFVNGSRQVNLFVEGSTDLRLTSSGTLPLNEWTHLFATSDGSTTASNYHIFFNGIEVSYSTTQNGVSPADNSGNSISIGMLGPDFIPWDGKITDVSIWSVQITDAVEISLLANSRVKRIPLQIQPSNLVAYLPMDECADGVSCDGVVFKDLSGNGNDGTGNDGANNTGLTGVPEEISTYQ